MTKSKTWKKNRDTRRSLAQSGDFIDFREYRNLVDSFDGWRRVWSDHIVSSTGQQAFAGIIRECDKYAVIKFKVYEAWGEVDALMEKTDLDRVRAILASPPPPQIEPPAEPSE